MKSDQIDSNLTNLPFEQILIRHFSNEVQLRQEFVLFFLLKGSMQVSVYGKNHLLQTHDIFFISPYEVHAVPHTSPDIHVLALFLQPEYLHTFCPDITGISFEQNMVRQSDTNPVYTSLCSSLADIIFHTIKTDSSARLKLIAAVSSILVQLIDAFGTKEVSDGQKPDYVREQISLLLDYLNNNYAEKITLSSAASVLGFHPQYFSAFFKKHFHVSFVDYLNTLRVNKSLTPLAYTDESITDIALRHGFSNHKTYSAFFGKLHKITPSTYRKERRLLNENSLLQDQGLDYFSFFQRYWSSELSHAKTGRTLQKHLTMSLSGSGITESVSGSIDPHSKYFDEHSMPGICYSVGRASAVLRNDIQQQIREAAGELKINTLRLRDIFSDDLFVYYEDEERNPAINWKYIDIIFDFLLDLGIKPFPEIGFMPRALASKKQYAGWLYRPNVSIPKSFKKWTTLVSGFMEHLLDRYGRMEVITWNFDFWTAPNLDIRDSYWNESKEDFFLFYRITYHAIKNVDPDIRLGSPNFSIPSGQGWYRDFFAYCQEYVIAPAYISAHLYNCEDDISPTAGSYSRFSGSWDNIRAVNTSRDTSLDNVRILKNILEEYGLNGLRLIISDWNLSFIPRDLVRDTCFMAPYILYTCIRTRGIVDTLCFRSLSDINEDFFIDQKPFHGGPGLMDFNGLKKASYYAFFLLGRMGQNVIESGENYLLTSSSKGLQLLLFHYVYYDSLYTFDDHSNLTYKQRYNIYESSEGLVIHTILALPMGSYRIREIQVSRSCGSAYDLWLKSGAQEEMDAGLISYLQKKGIPNMLYYTRESQGSLLLDTELSPHGVCLLEIEPVSGYGKP